MGKTAPTSSYFLTDQLLDRLPAVCPIKISDPDYLFFNFIVLFGDESASNDSCTVHSFLADQNDFIPPWSWMTTCQLDTCACVATIKFIFHDGVCYHVVWTDCVMNNILWSILIIFEGVSQNWMQVTFGQLSVNRIKKSLSMKWCFPLSGEIPQQLLMRQLRHHTFG